MTAISNKLYGLILAGGRSKRMGQDKSLLKYQGKSQLDCAVDLLTPFCAEVFVSTRLDQSTQEGYAHLRQIHDLPQFSEIGPIGGILSAMTRYPNVSWIILASDLPFVTEETIKFLVEQRKTGTFATAYTSASDNLPEPLCAIWEVESRLVMLEFIKKDCCCPRKILMKSNTHLILQKDKNWLNNVNNPQEFDRALKFINSCK